ncbi:MAG: alpha-galactosidase [Clostridia bacterium]|nr:alpha-galactosidase [Clostridia bacterium]
MKNRFILNKLTNGLELNEKWDGNICSISVTNKTDRDIKPSDLTVYKADMTFSPDTKFYGEGYNMLSQYGGTIRDFKLLGSFSDYDHYRLYRPEGMNQVYNMIIFYPEGEEPVLIGFASVYRFNGWIRFNEREIHIALNCENAVIGAGRTERLEEIFIEQGEVNTVLSHFADAIARNHPKRDFPEIPTGWCSWLVYGPNITEKNIYDNLDAIKRHGLNLKYIQIDDGYQEYWGDWFNFTDKFDSGVKQICLDIKEKGFEPAIWVAPFVAEKDSRLFKNHPDWFVKDDEGRPLSSGDVTFGGWRCAPWYILDMTHPGAQEYIRTVFTVMRHEWQIKYFKLDAIVWAALPFGHRYDDTKTAVEAYRMGMDIICDSVGVESFVLGGNSPMWPSIGCVNGMRVTNDNCRSWYQFTQLARECFHRNWQHNRLWINDPDTVLLQNEKIRIVGPDGKVSYKDGELTKGEFAFNAAYTMASGGMVLSSDDISFMTEENVELLRRLLPPTCVAAEFDGDDYTVGRARIDENKTIVYIFNFDNESKDVTVKIEGKREIFDLIENKPLGIFEGEIHLPTFEPHNAKVLICTKAQ